MWECARAYMDGEVGFTYVKPPGCPGRARIEDGDQALEVIGSAFLHSLSVPHHTLAEAVLAAIVVELHATDCLYACSEKDGRSAVLLR